MRKNQPPEAMLVDEWRYDYRVGFFEVMMKTSNTFRMGTYARCNGCRTGDNCLVGLNCGIREVLALDVALRARHSASRVI